MEGKISLEGKEVSAKEFGRRGTHYRQVGGEKGMILCRGRKKKGEEILPSEKKEKREKSRKTQKSANSRKFLEGGNVLFFGKRKKTSTFIKRKGGKALGDGKERKSA